MRKLIPVATVALYCIALWIVCDLAYSNLLHGREPRFRVANAIYHHGFAPNVATNDRWGHVRYPFFTNSLGLRDASAREVPLTANDRRMVLIGDSFTEAVGVRFEDSFAGLLAKAGQERPDQVEVLNAAAVSYSPAIYYKKIKHLIDSGLLFDELVVLPDISDVQNEATSYFCIDDDPDYRKYCRSGGAWLLSLKARLRSHFVVTAEAETQIRYLSRRLRGRKSEPEQMRLRAGWTIPGQDVERAYRPLGVEGGIARSLKNMQALADLLAARKIAMTVVVYPWPMQLEHDDRESRQVAIWRDFCAKNCKAFVDLFPAFFAEKDADSGWTKRLFIDGDVHFAVEGNRLMFRELERRLLPAPRRGREQATTNSK